MNRFIMIHFTCSSPKEAQEIIKALLEQKLIACATIIPEVFSTYIWEGEVESSKETKVIFKTKKALFLKIEEYLTKASSYDVPQILEVPISDGNKAYLEWLENNCQ